MASKKYLIDAVSLPFEKVSLHDVTPAAREMVVTTSDAWAVDL
jgi:hypothetical protein